MFAAPSRVSASRLPTEVEAAQAEERRAEVADLSRRVVTGVALTAPVFFAVMAMSLGAHWVPAVLLNHWVQLI